MNNKIQEKDLLLQVKSAIDDLFIAKIVKSQEGLEMSFPNGQKFIITVKEV